MYKLISNINEITEEDILNEVKFTTRYCYSNRYFQILKNGHGYYIYGMICGELPAFVTVQNYIKYWKTFNGVKKAIIGFSKNGSWGFSARFPINRGRVK